MGERVTSCSQMGVGSSDRDAKYLFFGDELYIGSSDEKHKDILRGSGKTPQEVLVAGELTVFKHGDEISSIIIDGYGSIGLQIEPRDATPVADFVRLFPDASGKDITAIK